MVSRKLLAAVLVVGLVGSAAAFATTTTTPSHDEPGQDSAYLRVVHASADAPAVDVQLDNETVVSNVTFGNVSDYLEVEAGEYNVSIVANETGEVVFDGNVTLEPRTVSTVAATGAVTENASAPFEPVIYQDNAFKPAENESAISVVHLSPDAPAVDVTTENGSVVLAEGVDYQNGSDYVAVPAGNYTVEIREASPTNNGTVLATANVSLESGNAYSAFAVSNATSDDATANASVEVVLAEDATLTLELPGDEMAPNDTANETTTEGDGETTTEEDEETTTEEDEETTEEDEETTTEEETAYLIAATH